MSIRLLHVSDLHARVDAQEDRRRIVAAVLRDARELAAAEPFQLAVVTGDLSYAGKPGELNLAHEILLEPLMRELGLVADQVILLPGNHDVDRDAINSITEAGLLAVLRDRESVNLVCDTPAHVAAATERLSAFEAFRAGFYAGATNVAKVPIGYVHRLQAGSRTIGIAALNSAWRCSGSGDRGNLLIGDRQLLNALDALDACDVRIVAMHHPLTWLAPWDGDLVRSELERRRIVVLTGHEHVSDPTAEASARGYAIYNRVGCLFERVGYPNSYSVLDLDLDAKTVDVHVRVWEPDVAGFRPDPTVGNAGTVDFPLTLPLATRDEQPSYARVQMSLADLAQQSSVVIDQLPELAVRSVDDVLVPPRFWPIPYPEVVAASTVARRDEAHSELDPMSLVVEQPVLLVSGDAESGVSSALLWLLARHFELDGSRMPVALPFDPRFRPRRFERALRRAIHSAGHALDPEAALPACIVAVDDVTPSRAMEAFVAYIAEHPEHVYVLGCHEGAHEAISQALREGGVDGSALFLGPFGRGQLRQLLAKLVGRSVSPEIVDHVLSIVDDQALPRTPFITVALLALLMQDADVSTLNITGVLDAYVGAMLGRHDHEVDGVGLDYRRREHFLGWFAVMLDRDDVAQLKRGDAERLALGYFRAKGWGPRHSASRVIDSLIERRILFEDARGVGFRHPALQDLFTAKATRDDAEFAATVLADPLRYANAVKHIAGLERNNAPLLERVMAATQAVVDQIGGEVGVEMFEHIRYLPGWSDEAKDVEQLKEALSAAESSEGAGFDEESWDELDDTLSVRRHVSQDSQYLLTGYLQHLGPALDTLACVLKNSELIDDLALKTKAFQDVVHAWSLLAVVLAVREDQSAEMRERVRVYLADDEAGEEENPDQIDRFIELITVLILVVAIRARVTTVQLEAPIAASLDDPAFMAPTAHALFATMAYCQLKFDGWVDRLARLYERHRRHPIVAELVLSWAWRMHSFADLTQAEQQALEHFLADAYTPTKSGVDAVPNRVAGRTEILRRLHNGRLIAQRRKELRAAADHHGRAGSPA